MSTIYEFFGYRADDRSYEAVEAAANRYCPFIRKQCEKTLNDGTVSGVCSIKPAKSAPVICCPNRLYAENHQILHDVAQIAFGPNLNLANGREAIAWSKAFDTESVAVFGKGRGGELHVPQKGGIGAYFVDWILALVDQEGALLQFVAVEVQSIDTTGNYRDSRARLLEKERTTIPATAGLNWENVNKRILPQLIYKGQVLQRERLCKSGLFFVCPSPVLEKVAKRLGGLAALPKYAYQPASVTFLGYEYDDWEVIDGEVVALTLETEHPTTVYKLQEAFNNVTLPEENVYRDAIRAALSD